MTKQSESMGHAELVGGGQTLLHTHPSGGGADYDYLRFLKSGYYHNGQLITTNTTQALTANRLYANPFILPITRTITRMAVHVTTLVAGATRLGIYQDNGSTYPGNLIIDAGVVDTGSTGLKAITGLSAGLSANILYWLVLVANAAPTLSAITAANLYPILGHSTALNVVGYSSYYVSYTYAALPASYPGSATMSNGNMVKIGVYF